LLVFPVFTGWKPVFHAVFSQFSGGESCYSNSGTPPSWRY